MRATRRTGRLPWPTRDELDGDEVAVYDAIVGSRSGSGRAAVVDPDGRLRGPFNAMPASPAVGDALQRLGAAIRYRGTLSDRVRELAILTVAARRSSAFEWFAHEGPARAAGLTDADLARIRSTGPGDAAEGRPGADELVRCCVAALLDGRDLDDAAFAALEALLGISGAVELVTLVGYYDLLALGLRTFRVPLPDGVDPPF